MKRALRPGSLVECPICHEHFGKNFVTAHVQVHFEHKKPKKEPKAVDDDDFTYVLPGTVDGDDLMPWGAAAVPFVPVFRPTVAEFQDPLNYIASISNVGHKFGICKIIPPRDDPAWQPSVSTDALPRSVEDNMVFRTKLQNIHQLKHRGSRAEAFDSSFEMWRNARGRRPATELPKIDGVDVDLWDLLRSVILVCGPLDTAALESRQAASWTLVLDTYLRLSILSGGAMTRLWGEPDFQSDAFLGRAHQLRTIYFDWLYEYDSDAHRYSGSRWPGVSDDEIRGFGYAQGPVQTLARFRAKCDEFVERWKLGDCSDEDLERIYWKLVESGESRIVVEYGNDLSVVSYGSAFPQERSNPLALHPWNLNVLPKMPTSLFHHTKEVIHGVTDPMLYFGSPFSSFAWHVEDQFLYSINFNHGGASKVWYGVGSSNADLLEATMKREVPELFDRHPDLLHQLVTAIAPATLRRAGVPVYKAVQQPGEFVVTFPRGYHGGFNAGFNLAEAVNFAMPDWIKFGVKALANYVETNRPSAFSHQELMLSCARSFPVSQVAVHLLQELYRLTNEYDALRHEIHRKGVTLFARQSESSALQQCAICLTDCYFSCVKCACEPSKRVCLGCVERLDWCKGTCQGLFFLERVPLDVLESLILKLETRLMMADFCKLSGCAECAPQSVKRPRSMPIIAKASKELKRLARRGGLTAFAPSMSRRRARLISFCEDEAANKLPSSKFAHMLSASSALASSMKAEVRRTSEEENVAKQEHL